MGFDDSAVPQTTLQPQNRMEEQALRAVVEEMNARGSNIVVPAMFDPYDWSTSNRETQNDNQQVRRGTEATIDALRKVGQAALRGEMLPEPVVNRLAERYPTQALQQPNSKFEARPAPLLPQFSSIPGITPATNEGTARRYEGWRGLIKHLLANLMAMVKQGGGVFSRELAEEFQNNAEFAAELTAEFNAIGYDLVPKPAPATAPRKTPMLSADRPRWSDQEGASNGPVAFIKTYFGEMVGNEWHHCGVVRSDLNAFKGLYNAYASWINRNPNDELTFAAGAVGRPRKPGMEDERRRRDRERKQKLRECDRLAHP